MQYVTTRDGRHIAYGRFGAGPTIIAHPGGPGFGGGVLGDLGGLDEHFELVVVDPRGVGESDRAPDGRYELDGYVDDLEDLIAEVGMPRAVLGHSHGGLVALSYAARGPDGLGALVIVDTPSHVDGALSEGAGGPDGRVGQDDADRPLIGGGPTEDGLPRLASFGSPSHAYESALVDERIHAAPLEYFNDHVLADFDLRSVLALVDVPTVVICGRGDELAAPQASYDLALAVPQGWLAVVEGSGHVPFLENPEAFRDAVLAHVATD